MKKEEFIALGISKELAGKAAYASKKELEGFIPKKRFEEVNEAKKSLERDVQDKDSWLEELKKVNRNNENLQRQIEQLQEENKAEKEKYESELKNLKISNAVKAAVAGKVHDEELVADLIDKEKLVISDDGKIIGLDEQVKSLQSTKAFLFKGGESRLLIQEVEIKPGSKIEIIQNGITTEYKQSSVPVIYASHQEIGLKLYERWV